MMEITTQIEIRTTAELLWGKLTRFDQYPRWNPFIHSIQGYPVRGHRLSIELTGETGKSTRFTPILVEVLPLHELRWVGKVMSEFLFRGEHFFRITTTETGGTLLIHGERFSGLLAPFLWPWIRNSTRRGFEKMNAALKTELEPAGRDIPARSPEEAVS